jgi:hypothetical protein
MRPTGNEVWRERIRRSGAPLQAGAVPRSRLSGPCINRERDSEGRAAR